MSDAQFCLALWGSILTIATVVGTVGSALEWVAVRDYEHARRYRRHADRTRAEGWTLCSCALGVGCALSWSWFWLIYLNVV